MTRNSYMTPSELITKYPDVESKFNWSSREIGVFLRCKLVDGYYDRRRRASLIQETSFVKLVHFTNDSIERQKLEL